MFFCQSLLRKLKCPNSIILIKISISHSYWLCPDRAQFRSNRWECRKIIFTADRIERNSGTLIWTLNSHHIFILDLLCHLLDRVCCRQMSWHQQPGCRVQNLQADVDIDRPLSTSLDWEYITERFWDFQAAWESNDILRYWSLSHLMTFSVWVSSS